MKSQGRVGECVFAHLPHQHLKLVGNDKPVAHPTWLPVLIEE